MNVDVPDLDPTLEDLRKLAALASHWGRLADCIQHSIKLRPMVGEPGSPYALDFAQNTLNERSLMFGLPGSLGLLQGMRANAHALAAKYETYGPPVIGPAPFSLMRGVWEHAVLLVWLLDGSISSPERVGRFKAWLADGLTRTAKTFRYDIEEDIQAALNEWDSPAPNMPGSKKLSWRYSTEGEAIYRELSGIVHGRSWTILAAMENCWEGDGFKTGWRGYAFSLHQDFSEPTSQVGCDASRRRILQGQIRILAYGCYQA